jgi:hypothetical protein
MKRIRVLIAAAVVLPMALPAQQPAAAPQQPTANGTTQSFRAFGAHYGGWLIAAFDSIPAGKYGYKPTPRQQTVGYIAQHLEDANYELCALFGGVKRAMTASERDGPHRAEWCQLTSCFPRSRSDTDNTTSS